MEESKNQIKEEELKDLKIEKEVKDELLQGINRRGGLYDSLPAEVALLRREKKISIKIPEYEREGCKRLNKVYLSSKKYKHLINELKGGVYGVSSRPELEIHDFEFEYQHQQQHQQQQEQQQQQQQQLQEQESKKKLIHIELVYDPENNLYIITNHIEEKLLSYVIQNSHLPSIKYKSLSNSTQRIGLNEFCTLDLYKQRQWRKFLLFYIQPLLQDPIKIQKSIDYMTQLVEIPETENYITPEDSDNDNHSTTTDSDSDDDKNKKKKRKGKKRTGKGGTSGNTSNSKTSSSLSKKGTKGGSTKKLYSSNNSSYSGSGSGYSGTGTGSSSKLVNKKK